MGNDSDSGHRADGEGEAALEKYAGSVESSAVSQDRGTVCRRPRGVDRAAMYGLGGSDTSDTPVEEGAVVRARAPV